MTLNKNVIFYDYIQKEISRKQRLDQIYNKDKRKIFGCINPTKSKGEIKGGFF